MNSLAMEKRIREAAGAARSRCGDEPRLGLILGSGLGRFADKLERRTVIPCAELPHFPAAAVSGHEGNLVLGESGGVPVAVLQGRVHYYEGYPMAEAAFPVRVLGALGVRQLVVTSAAGGINPEFRPGDLMLITDHINLTGANPLIGPNLDTLGPRFPDMSEAYDAAMRECAVQAAAEIGIPVRQGVYIGLSGPNYETPAEIRMCRTLGADAVGMSTVGEVIVANHMGIGVLGISCITNLAAGIAPQRLTHAEVMETTGRVGEQFGALLSATIPRLPRLLADALRRGNDDQ